MNGVKYLDFKFVDRQRESIIIENFLHSRDPEILWILGNSGVGKSFFLKNTIYKKSLGNVIYINIDKKDTTANCVSDLILHLESFSDMTFVDFIKRNYAEIIDFGKSVVSICTGFKYKDIIDILFDQSRLFVNKKQEQVNSVSVMGQYLDTIIQISPIVIAIDNFTYCDKASVNIILDFMKLYLRNPQVRFIISTTTSEIEKNFELKKDIISQIPYKSLEILPFDSKDYFVEILSYIFDLENIPYDTFNQIYKFCEGIPERLQILITNLRFKEGILETTSLPKLDIQKLSKELLSSKKRLDINNIGLYPKLILLLVVCISVPISLNILYKLVNYYIRETMHFGEMSEDKFSDIISEQENNTIEIKFENNVSKVYVKHDLLIEGLIEDFNNEHLIELASKIIYEFIIQNKSLFDSIGISDENFAALVALHSYTAKINSWIDLNYSYGESKLQKSNYSAACEIFLRLDAVQHLLTAHQRITLGICFYENGLYDKSSNCFMEISLNDVEKSDLYNYHFYYGKSLNMCAQKDTAIVHFREAIKQTNPNTDKNIEAYNLLHLALIETPYGKKEAYHIFETLTHSLNEENMYKISIARLLKGCGNFYSGKEALEKFELAKKIAQKFDNQLEIAYIRHNMGFEYIRENNLSLALSEFYEALSIVEKIKIHETAYIQNNIAICYMLSNKYDLAISVLKNALFIAKSYYAKLTLQVHLMHACRLNGEIEECRKYQNNLLNALSDYSHKDPTLLRKLKINLALNYFALGETINANYYLQQIFKLCIGTSSEYRAYRLQYELSEHPISLPERLLNIHSNYITNMSFEPWCITFSHD